jgi:long-chain acyl-CoA synthetase
MNAGSGFVLPSSVCSPLPQLFAWRVAAPPRAAAHRQFDAESAAWASIGWAECGQRVGRWRRALAALGRAPGARVAILLPNGIDAVCIDLAALQGGVVPVPMHALDNPSTPCTGAIGRRAD